MESIKTLREIISVLTAEEKVSARTYLKAFVEKGRADINRALALFEYLVTLEDRKKTIEEIELAVYKVPNKPALKRLANRTKEKVLEVMINDINVHRAGMYPECIVMNIFVAKKNIQAKILHRRGKLLVARSMVEKVIRLCKKYELYEELLIGLRFLMKTRPLEEGRKLLPALRKEYNTYDYAKNAVINAELNFAELISQNDFHSDHSIGEKQLRKMLDEMYDDFKKTNSAIIGFYYFHLEAQNFQHRRDYLNARKELLANYRLVKNNAAIHTQDNLIGVLLNLADNDLSLAKFDRVFDQAEEASLLCNTGSINHETCVEIMFYAKFYKGEYQIASNLLFQLIPDEEQTNTFRAGKRNYLLAAAFFMQQDYQTARRWVSLINPIEADKEGWNLGIKILQIMTAIELNEFDEATAKVEALRKYFANGNGTKNHRAQMINNIFISLTNNGYNFKTTYQELKATVDMLSEYQGALEWLIKSSEMIIFHQWFVAKATRQIFIQVVSSYQLEENTDQDTNEELVKKDIENQNSQEN